MMVPGAGPFNSQLPKLHGRAVYRFIALNSEIGCSSLPAAMFPYEITPVEKSENERIISCFSGEDQFYQIGPKKFIMNSSYPDHAEGFYNIEVKEDDVWIVTYPRSGTTWTQELVWLLTHDLDFEKAKTLRHMEKVLFIEQSILVGKGFKDKAKEKHNDDPKLLEFFKKMDVLGYEAVKTLESPRCIKSHLALSILPPNLLDKAKVVYVARNPKDCAVSNFYHNQGGPNGFSGDFDQYWPLFKDGLLLFGPHIEHVKEGWERRGNPNMLFLFFEDLKKDLPSMIRKMASFLGKYVSDKDVEALANFLSFENMKSLNESLGSPFPKMENEKFKRLPHFRKGEVGYKDEYKNIGKKADDWLEELIETTGIPFHKTGK
ncbi:hypothetical protein GE061_013847 [Apolygus lucorum]|uniref:Sulfotransferase domain-containing protein n=1 Tax=Apolygus lucorum TaxID=248454 RepID=A0A8S9XP58_APOLU|nr:hypothetical protein GE061_013847 [Apolygus lucorum]